MKTSVLKNIWRVGVVLLVNLLVIAVAFYFAGGPDAIETLSRYGSTGEEVRQIQTKLNELGYDTGGIDGTYGTKTKNDGIAGPKTLEALGIGSSGSSGGGSYSDSDVELLARIISAEARGEPYTGQVAVGAVVLNRVEHPSFPNTLAGVVYQPGAFSALNDGQFNKPVADSARRAAQDAINGWDPSGGAIYYYNPAKSTNQWIFSRPVITTIGAHRFCS